MVGYIAPFTSIVVLFQVAETREDAEDVEDCMDEVDADYDEDAGEDAEDGDEQNADMGGYDEGSPMLDRSDSGECVYEAPSPEMLDTLSPNR